MPIPAFQMSEQARGAIAFLMSGKTDAEKQQLLDALSLLCTEVEVYCTIKAMESLHQQWASSLGTMLRYGNR